MILAIFLIKVDFLLDFFYLSKNKTGFLDFDDCFRGYAGVLFGKSHLAIFCS